MIRPSRMLVRVSAALALGVVAAGPLKAQRLDSLTVGARLRVTSLVPARPEYGALVSADSVVLVFAPERGGAAVSTHLVDLRRVEVSQGARPRSQAFRRGARIGLLVGVGLGAVATSLALRADLRGSCDCYIPATAVVGVLSLAFTGVTTLVGGGIGVATREQWRQVWPPR